jgi:hypothetical protein
VRWLSRRRWTIDKLRVYEQCLYFIVYNINIFVTYISDILVICPVWLNEATLEPAIDRFVLDLVVKEESNGISLADEVGMTESVRREKPKC